MTITANWFGHGLKHILNAEINWTTDTIKCAAYPHSTTIAQATNEFFSDLTGELTTANGYTAGGATLGTKSITLSSETVSLLAAATVWTPSSGQTLTIGKLVVYKSTGTSTTSQLLGFVDLGADTSAIGAAFTVTWDATNGVLQAVAS